MNPTHRHIRVLEVPGASLLSEAYLDDLYEIGEGKARQLVLDYQELQLTAPLTWTGCLETPCEQVEGIYLPRRLRFGGLRWVKRQGLYTHLEDAPAGHVVRSLCGYVYWRSPEQENYFVLMNGDWEEGRLDLSPSWITYEERSGSSKPVKYTRDWSPPPPLLPGLVPNFPILHQRYGGDPVTIHLGKRTYCRRLFVGSLENQGLQRPWIDAVLNLSEEASRWTESSPQHPTDRWANKGEGRLGMDEVELTGEAQWVIERLQQGKSVLVHCSAGMNRSVTVCCAALILLEGLSAEAALARVREHHRWARPDTRHWLALRWLARRNFDSQGEKRV